MISITKSFRSIRQFLTLQSDNVQSAITMATGGLDGLWFVANEQFINKAMDLCNSVYVAISVGVVYSYLKVTYFSWVLISANESKIAKMCIRG